LGARSNWLLAIANKNNDNCGLGRFRGEVFVNVISRALGAEKKTKEKRIFCVVKKKINEEQREIEDTAAGDPAGPLPALVQYQI
jgi:uncharacterized protein (UPF0216 family)